MAIDPKKWTTKTQEAVAAASDMARSAGHPEVTVDHVPLPQAALVQRYRYHEVGQA